MMVASTRILRALLAFKRLRPAALHTIAAAAPSLTGEHIGRVSGKVIGAALNTSSTEKAFWYCDSGFMVECW